MTDELRPKHRKPLPLRRIAFYSGIALILAGYGFLSISPETGLATAEKRAFTGLGLIIGGAFLWPNSESTSFLGEQLNTLEAKQKTGQS